MPVYKDEKRGTWYVSIRFTNWMGKPDRKVKRGFAKEGEAKQWEIRFLAKESRECDMKLRELYELYKEDLTLRVEESTIDTKDNIIVTKVLPYFGDVPVNQISRANIRKWQVEMMSLRKPNGEQYAPTYLYTIYSQFNALMNHAVTFYHLSENPLKAAGSIGSKKAGEMEFWTLDEFQQFIAHVDHPEKRIFFQMLYWGGHRLGENLALRSMDMRPAIKAVFIDKTHKRKNRKDSTSDRKNDDSYDLILPDFVYNELEEYVSKLYGLKPKDRIFDFTAAAARQYMDRTIEKAGVKRIKVHGLRHSQAALLIEMGYPIEVVADRLKDSIKVASETYAHLYPNKQADVASNLNQLQHGFAGQKK